MRLCSEGFNGPDRVNIPGWWVDWPLKAVYFIDSFLGMIHEHDIQNHVIYNV